MFSHWLCDIQPKVPARLRLADHKSGRREYLPSGKYVAHLYGKLFFRHSLPVHRTYATLLFCRLHIPGYYDLSLKGQLLRDSSFLLHISSYSRNGIRLSCGKYHHWSAPYGNRQFRSHPEILSEVCLYHFVRPANRMRLSIL